MQFQFLKQSLALWDKRSYKFSKTEAFTTTVSSQLKHKIKNKW
jgi:hypothetical protein